MFGGGSSLSAKDMETKYRPIAFCLALAFAFRYTWFGFYDTRRFLNFITFGFIVVHIVLKVQEYKGAEAIMAGITVLLFHFIASILIPSFVFFNLTDVFLGLFNWVFGMFGGFWEFRRYLDLIPPIIVTIIWCLLFVMVDKAVIWVFDALKVFKPIAVSTEYEAQNFMD